MEDFYICRLSVAPLRAEPSDRAEMVSQLLFGDRVRLISKSDRWWQVVTRNDKYEGWMDPKQLFSIDAATYNDEENFDFQVPLQYENIVLDELGGSYRLSPGSTLPFYSRGRCFLGEREFTVNFPAIKPSKLDFEQNILNTALFFLNTPYLWGGRTTMGIDCSGFSQIVFKILGVSLPRDASQQVDCGTLVDFLESARLGDLAFFDNADGKIIHVGIMLSNNQIIHAAGRVRIDRVDTQGIYSDELEKYTHQLRIIKRMM